MMLCNTHRTRLVALLTLFLALLPVIGWSAARTALVIGNADYRNDPLNNPVNDARDVAKALEALDFKVIKRENVTKRDFVKAVNELAQQLRARGGVGLFYYSGHGVQVKGNNYLIPVHTSIDSAADVEFEAVDAGRVLRNMELAGSRLNIVILDACRDNPYKGWYKGSGTKGLVRIDAPTGSIIAYATAPGQTADDGIGRNSPYTRHLLAVMPSPGLSIEHVFKQVRIRVARDTDNRQVPWESSSLMGPFAFVPGQAEVVAPGTPVPSPFKLLEPELKRLQVFQDVLSDGTRGPEMVVIPAGEFMMGSPSSEEGRFDRERPHRVQIERDFAMGKYEVTFAQYDRFGEATGRKKPSDNAWKTR